MSESRSLEVRFFELRQQGPRLLTGIGIRYGDTARLMFGGERFRPGAFGDVSELDVILNRQHSRLIPLARTGGGGLELDDNERRLLVKADLPETSDADDTLVLVKKRILRGFSIEFYATEEHQEDRVRVVDEADLVGIGVVDRPAYTDSVAAARALGSTLEEFEEWSKQGQARILTRSTPEKRRRRRWL